MDTKQYLTQKELGLVTMVSTGTKEEPSFTIVKKNWNPDTGEQIDDTFTEIKVEELETRKKELQKEISQIDTFLVETGKIEALPVEEVVK